MRTERARVAPLFRPPAVLTSVPLSRAAASAARRAATSLDWPSAYRVIATDLLRNGAADDPDTPRWYALAAEINDPGSRHFIHYFTRLYLTIEVRRQTGLTLDPAGEAVQRCSDQLAEIVLGDLIEGRCECVGSFVEVGPIETVRMTRKLVPGLVLDRTVWPAYAQLAWLQADRRFHGWLGRFLPFWRRGLPRWACPAETFIDHSYLDDLTPGERTVIVTSAREAMQIARACVRAERWVTP